VILVDRRLAQALRYLFLFGLSVVLVLGFWFHAEFYALGLVPLALGGGAVVMLVILTARSLLGESRPRPGNLPRVCVDSREGQRLRGGAATLLLGPAEEPFPVAGTRFEARYPGGELVGAYRVVRLRRRWAADLTKQHALDAGVAGESELQADLEARGLGGARRLLRIAQVEPLGGRS
jgi:hypothetical protein